jgi:PAS domain S-box-containing protein
MSLISGKNSDKEKLNRIGLRVADQVNAMLAYWDCHEICRFANNAYRDWFHKSREEMVDKITMKELLGPLYEKNLPYIKAALAGEKQVFERDIPTPDGKIRNSLATYIPDIINGEVMGFYVHVADVTHIKELENKLLNSRREMLRNVIEAQEKERTTIAEALRDSVNQTLAYCKIITQSKIKSEGDFSAQQELAKYLHQAITELNSLSFNLSPSSIEMFGFIGGVNHFIENFKPHHPININFQCADKNIKSLGLNNELSIFRIIQDFLIILSEDSSVSMITIVGDFNFPLFTLQIVHDSQLQNFPTNCNEFKDIEHRVEYYTGNIKIEANDISIQLEIR